MEESVATVGLQEEPVATVVLQEEEPAATVVLQRKEPEATEVRDEDSAVQKVARQSWSSSSCTRGPSSLAMPPVSSWLAHHTQSRTRQTIARRREPVNVEGGLEPTMQQPKLDIMMVSVAVKQHARR